MTVMFDSVDTPLLPAGYAYAGYIDGEFANYGTIKTRFPSADIMSIAVRSVDDADCLDIESGDATPEQAVTWITRQVARGITRPCLYANASTMSQVLTAMRIAGIARETLRLWSAHYDGEHICGPSSCGQMSIPADGTQWTDTARGINLDQSLLLDGFFGESITYLTLTEMETMMNVLPVLIQGMSDATLPHWYIRRLQAIMDSVYGIQTVIDGVYGPSTATAVKALQKQLGLTQDGICGPATWTRVVSG